MTASTATVETVFLHAAGLCAPGLAGWQMAAPVLRGERGYVDTAPPAFASDLLPRNERRRLSAATRLALQAAEDVFRQSSVDSEQVRTVFASCCGDGATIDRICRDLMQPQRPVSPTQFHNSVHNSAAGYWAIATHCQCASISLSAHDGSFCAGLVEAYAAARIADGPVLLIAYEHPLPSPLAQALPVCAPFAVALLLNAGTALDSLGALSLTPIDRTATQTSCDPALEPLRAGNPAARALPLLQLLARGVAGRVVLPYLPQSMLAVDVTQAGSGA
ncbi:MAG: beta-ketoacyl synthase chain length factor [Nitrococcus sp.]|nr:beta-ketoacyl synthase chain length factor [Nitrococcus sp.]